MIDLQREVDVMPAMPAHVLIKVTNRNPFTLRDRYDGVPVFFKPNETVTISRDQAQHFFGYPGEPLDMAIHMAKRFGWNQLQHVQVDPNDGPEGPMLYQKYAWNIQFAEQEFELVPKEKLADDGLETVDQLPAGPPPPTPQAEDPSPSRVGRRKGSPAKSRHGARKPTEA